VHNNEYANQAEGSTEQIEAISRVPVPKSVTGKKYATKTVFLATSNFLKPITKLVLESVALLNST
jgi:hypothetical protein